MFNETEQRLKELFQNRWFHSVFQALTALLCTWWWFHIPAPGKAILALTIAAVFLTIEGISGWQKALWLVLVFLLAFLENQAINTDRTAFAREQSEARAREAEEFGNIAGGINSAISASNNQFQATMTKESQVLDTSRKVSELARQNLQNVTGGSAYAVVEPSLMQRPDRDIPLSIKNQGRNILTGVSVTLYDVGLWLWGTHDSIVHSTENRITNLTLHPGERLVLPRQIKPEQFMQMKEDEGNGKADMYRVFVSIAAQNFTSTEYLDFKRDDKNHWLYTYKIYRQGPVAKALAGKPLPDCLLEQIDWSENFNQPIGRKLGRPCGREYQE